MGGTEKKNEKNGSEAFVNKEGMRRWSGGRMGRNEVR